jgi:hypothetical protein
MQTGPKIITPIRPRGELVALYATGLGQTNPNAVDGKVVTGLETSVAPVSVTIGGLNARVVFAGDAPGFVGLSQINVIVPQDVTPSEGVPISIVVGGHGSLQFANGDYHCGEVAVLSHLRALRAREFRSQKSEAALLAHAIHRRFGRALGAHAFLNSQSSMALVGFRSRSSRCSNSGPQRCTHRQTVV